MILCNHEICVDCTEWYSKNKKCVICMNEIKTSQHTLINILNDWNLLPNLSKTRRINWNNGRTIPGTTAGNLAEQLPRNRTCRNGGNRCRTHGWNNCWGTTAANNRCGTTMANCCQNNCCWNNNGGTTG